MTDLVDAFPPLGLEVTCGPVRLGPLTDDVLPRLLAVAESGIHEPGLMPFSVPWTDTPRHDFARQFLSHHWTSRGSFGPDAWTLNFAVYHDGTLVGSQAYSTQDFLVTRTGETGSWLGRAFQGRGVGTLMRQAICVLAFDHLDAEEITSGAFLDNPASLAVSRKVGYRENGRRRLRRREGEMAPHQALVLGRDDLVRPPYPLRVTGLAPFRRFIGLDPAQGPQ